MGKRGPQKTPTRALENRGSWRAKERDGEVDVSVFTDDCPEWLTVRAMKNGMTWSSGLCRLESLLIWTAMLWLDIVLGGTGT